MTDLTVEQAAERLKVDEGTVATLCRAGWLSEEAKGPPPHITTEAVAAYQRLKSIASRGTSSPAEADKEMGLLHELYD